MLRSIPTITVILLIVIILGGIFLWWPQYEKFQGLRAELQEKEKALKQKEEYFVKLAAAAQQLEQYQQEVAKIGTALPDEPDQADVLNFIGKAGSANGLVINKINSVKIPKDQDKKEEIQKVSFDISFVGSYSALKNFLSEIYKSSRLIEIDSLKFDSQESRGGIYEFDIVFSARYYPKTQIK